MKYLDELKSLNLPAGKYAIFGSGPLAIRNLRDNDDVDLIVKQDLWKELLKDHELSANGKSIKIGHIEIFHDWPPFEDSDSLIDDAEIIEDLPFVKLNYVVRWKNTRKSEKDLNDLKLIEKFLSGHR
jgi:hypothetical protein